MGTTSMNRNLTIKYTLVFIANSSSYSVFWFLSLIQNSLLEQKVDLRYNKDISNKTINSENHTRMKTT